MSNKSNNINNLTDFIYKIRKHPDFGPSFVHLKHIPAVEADYGNEIYLTEELAGILHKNKIERLYRHQKEAILKIRNNENVIIATPTASGKSLIYNLPILEGLIAGKDSKALYLFPLKALEQDQLKVLASYLKNIRSRKIVPTVATPITTVQIFCLSMAIINRPSKIF